MLHTVPFFTFWILFLMHVVFILNIKSDLSNKDPLKMKRWNIKRANHRIKRRVSPKGAGMWVSSDHFCVPWTRSQVHQPTCGNLWLLMLFSWNYWFSGPNLVLLHQQLTRRSPTNRNLHFQMSSHRISLSICFTKKKREWLARSLCQCSKFSHWERDEEDFSKSIYNLVYNLLVSPNLK